MNHAINRQPMCIEHKVSVAKVGIAMLLFCFFTACGGRESVFAPYNDTIYEESRKSRTTPYNEYIASETTYHSDEEATISRVSEVSVDPVTGEYVIPSASNAARTPQGDTDYSDAFRDTQIASIVVRNPEESATRSTSPARQSYNAAADTARIVPDYADVSDEYVSDDTAWTDIPMESMLSTPNTADAQYSAHLASYRRVEQAYDGLEVLQNAFPQLLRNKRFHVSRVSIPEKGTFFRLKAGPYATKHQATDACQQFEAFNQYCDVTVFDGEEL